MTLKKRKFQLIEEIVQTTDENLIIKMEQLFLEAKVSKNFDNQERSQDSNNEAIK